MTKATTIGQFRAKVTTTVAFLEDTATVTTVDYDRRSRTQVSILQLFFIGLNKANVFVQYGVHFTTITQDNRALVVTVVQNDAKITKVCIPIYYRIKASTVVSYRVKVTLFVNKNTKVIWFLFYSTKGTTLVYYKCKDTILVKYNIKNTQLFY